MAHRVSGDVPEVGDGRHTIGPTFETASSEDEFGIGGCEFPCAIGILPECLSGENCRDDKYCRRFQ
jgi:hypothetical protein